MALGRESGVGEVAPLGGEPSTCPPADEPLEFTELAVEMLRDATSSLVAAAAGCALDFLVADSDGGAAK